MNNKDATARRHGGFARSIRLLRRDVRCFQTGLEATKPGPPGLVKGSL